MTPEGFTIAKIAFKRLLLIFCLGITLGNPSASKADEPSWVLSIGTSDQFYSQKALNRAYEAFFGRPRTRSGGGSTFGDGNLSFGDNDDVEARLKTSREITAGKSWEIWRHELWSAHRTIRLSVGERRYFLPDGFDILIDPVQVAFTYGHISGDYSLQKELPIGRKTTAFGSIGIGLTAYHAGTHISSALINTRSSISGVEPFVPASIGLRRDIDRGRVFVKATINGYPKAIYDLKVSVGYEF